MDSLPINQAEIREQEVPRGLMQQLFDQAPDALLLVNAKGKIVMINSQAEQLFGYEPLQLVGHSPIQLLPTWSKSLAKCSPPLDEDRPGGTGIVSNMPALRSHGDEFCAEVSLRNIAQGDNLFTIASIREKTPSGIALMALKSINQELRITNANLVSLSMTDPLTELLNRRGLENILQREISYSKRNETELVVAMVDLDDFKAINDKSGHAYGDSILRKVAQTLKDGLRTVDWIGRIGGDEFLILLPCTGLAVAVKVAERIRLALSETQIRTVDSGTTRLTASFGIVTLPTSIQSIDEVLELTSANLKASKRRGKNRISFDDVDDCSDVEVRV